MRIVLLSQSVDDESGIGRIVLSLARQFHMAGHDVRCLAQHIGVAGESFVCRQVPSLPISNGLNKLAYRFLASRALDRLKYDIIHAFGVGNAADIVSAQSCHRAGMAILREYHANLTAGSNWGLYDRVSLADERRLITSSRTRKVIAASHLVKRQIMEYYRIGEDRIAVVPNGVDMSRFVPPKGRGELRRAMGIPDGRFVLLFIGNEFGRKGLAVLIRSLGMMHDDSIHLLVAGRDNPAPYKRLAHEMNCLQAVTFAGKIVSPERLYALADAFVLPAMYEPFGMVVVEAMAAGLPVIATADCGALEGLKDGEHGIFLGKPGDMEELTGAIRRIVSDRQLRERFGRAGREAALKFDWSLVSRQILDVYNEVLGPAGKEPLR